MALLSSLLAHKASGEAEASARAIMSQASDGCGNDSVHPQAWSGQFRCPHGSALSTLSLLTHYLEQQDIQRAFKEKHLTKNSGAAVGQASQSQAAVGLSCMRPRAPLTSGPGCTAPHAASLTASVQILARAKSLLLSYLLLQTLPSFIDCQPKSALLPSQSPL